jgi:hypothetical protein
MRKLIAVLVNIVLVALLGSMSFAAKSYVVTNNDNPSGNSVTIYALDSASGTLNHLLDLPTGGLGSNGGYFATVGVGAVATGPVGCLYAYDSGSSDIAAFHVDLGTLDIVKVGNFSNPGLLSAYPGGSLALTPNSKFLYANYPTTENLAAWKINSDCSLTLLAIYTASVGPDLYDGMKVTPNGKSLLVTAPDFQAVEMFNINADGTLADVGFANFGALSECMSIGCYPAGIDITADSKVAIFGNYTLNAATVLGAAITPTGLKKATVVDLPNTGTLTTNDNVPFLSNGAYHGSGLLFFGFSGIGAGSQPGVVTTNYSEGKKSIKILAVTPINTPSQYMGLIASSGQWLVVSEWFNELQVFKANPDGTLTPTAQGPVVNNNANGAYSFFLFPNTR